MKKYISLCLLGLVLSNTYTSEILVEKVENKLKIESKKDFTKEEIILFGYNPEVVTNISQIIVVLPTEERILYTNMVYTCYQDVDTFNDHPTFWQKTKGHIKSSQVIVTTTKLDKLPKTDIRK